MYMQEAAWTVSGQIRQKQFSVLTNRQELF